MRVAAQPRHGAPERGGTVYLATADAGGMLVSFIQSNYHGFGDGYLAASDHRKDGQAVGF